MRIIKIMVLLLLLLPNQALPHEDQRDQPPLKIGVIPYKAPRSIIQLFQPLSQLLEEKTGHKIQIVTAPDFAQFLDRVYQKQYDIIFLGYPFYLKAHAQAGYEAIARGYPSFKGGLIVAKESDLHTLNDLSGLEVAAVSELSQGGYTLQKKALEKQGVPVTFKFLGRVDSVVYAILNKQSPAGAIRLDVLDKAAFSGWQERVRLIYTTPEIPQFPFAVHAQMSNALRQTLAETLCSISAENQQGAAILNNFNVTGFEQVDDAAFDAFRGHPVAEESAE